MHHCFANGQIIVLLIQMLILTIWKYYAKLNKENTPSSMVSSSRAYLCGSCQVSHT
jgi:hypothetical protein